jgi:hypothetical protein
MRGTSDKEHLHDMNGLQNPLFFAGHDRSDPVHDAGIRSRKKKKEKKKRPEETFQGNFPSYEDFEGKKKGERKRSETDTGAIDAALEVAAARVAPVEVGAES